jgi:hypothetical protein
VSGSGAIHVHKGSQPQRTDGGSQFVFEAPAPTDPALSLSLKLLKLKIKPPQVRVQSAADQTVAVVNCC